MAFSKALPHEIPELIKKYARNPKNDAKFWTQHLPAVSLVAPKMLPSDVAHTLWAIAKLPAKPTVQKVFQDLEPFWSTEEHLSKFMPRELGTIAGAYAQANIKSWSHVFPQLAERIKRFRADESTRETVDFEPMDCVKLLHAFAKVRAHGVAAATMREFALEELTQWIDHLYPRDVASVIWALGHLGASAEQSATFIEHALHLGSEGRLNAVDICNVAYGMGKMKVSSEQLNTIGTLALNHLESMSPNNIATLVWAIGKSMRDTGMPPSLRQAIERGSSKYTILDAMFVLQGLVASGDLSYSTWAAILYRLQELAPTLKEMDVVHIVPALVKCPDPALCPPLIEALHPKLVDLKPKDSIFVLHAFSTLKLRPPSWDVIEASLQKIPLEKVPVTLRILCLSALSEKSSVVRKIIIDDLEQDILWTGEFRNVVSVLTIDHITDEPIWNMAVKSFRLQAPKLPLTFHMLKACDVLVKRDFHKAEIIALMTERLSRRTTPLSVAELELAALLLEQVDVFDLNAWAEVTRSWALLKPRPPEFLASCAKVHYRPDITLDWVQSPKSFEECVLLLQVLVKLDYSFQIPWHQLILHISTRETVPLRSLGLFLHTTCFAPYTSFIQQRILEVFQRLPVQEWDLFSAAQILTALVHWQPIFSSLHLEQLRRIAQLLPYAEKGATKRERIDSQSTSHRGKSTTWESQRPQLAHGVFEALEDIPLREVRGEVQAGPYAIDLVVRL